ncbi:MAG: MarR family transcriptional regulator [Thermoplasmatota archaeon]
MFASPFSGLRGDILHWMSRSPGATPSDVARAFAVDHSTATYHLRRLSRAGLLTEAQQGRAMRYFPTGCGICPYMRGVLPILRDTRYTKILDKIEERGWATPADLGPSIEESLVRGRLRRLRDARLIRRGPAGWELTPETMVCRARARSDGACDMWGHCPISRAWREADVAA